jgi:hypothetical protein
LGTKRHEANVEAADSAVDVLQGQFGAAALAELVRAGRTLFAQHADEDALAD